MQLVYRFGSSARAGATHVRDVDVAVLAAPRIDGDELLRMGADVGAAVGLAIDLVSLNDAGIVLAHEIVTGGECLYAAAPDILDEYAARVHMRYLDWLPFVETQWRLTAERIRERRS